MSPSDRYSKPPSMLTPQRKHRKLLKDGSGTEVWPESNEYVFIQGLREYWNSPMATYSRGRSRWRNQFLVEYLQKAGIIRTKKQVASHIQVLRNMWKGEPEYHLVAGGEELFAESGILASVKLEDMPEGHRLLKFDDASSFSSGGTSSASFSPPEGIKSEIPSSPTSLSSPMYCPEAYSPSTHMSFPVFSVADSPSSPTRDQRLLLSTPLEGSDLLSSSTTLEWSQRHSHGKMPLHSVPSVFDAHVLPNRATNICLYAETMTPLSIKIDVLIPPVPPPARAPPAMLKIKLYVSSMDDPRCGPSIHGFVGNISLASAWKSYATCVTCVYEGGACTYVETGALQLTNVDTGVVLATLPESSLSRCRWLNSELQSGLTQRIIVDGEPLIYLIYELDRQTTRPAAKLLGYRRVESDSLENNMVPQQYHRATPHQNPNVPSPATSLSHALGPPAQLF